MKQTFLKKAVLFPLPPFPAPPFQSTLHPNESSDTKNIVFFQNFFRNGSQPSAYHIC